MRNEELSDQLGSRLVAMETNFAEFIQQYDHDMRGDKELGNGTPGLIGSVRHLQKVVDELAERTRINHDAIYGSDKDKKSDGLRYQVTMLSETVAKYNRAVWIVFGAFLTSVVGLLMTVF